MVRPTKSLHFRLALLSIVLFVGAVIVGVVCIPHIHLESLDGAFGLQHIRPGFGIFSIVLLAP